MGNPFATIPLQESLWLLDRVSSGQQCAGRAIGYRQALGFLEASIQDESYLTPENLVGQ